MRNPRGKIGLTKAFIIQDNITTDSMSDGQRENRQEVEPLSVPFAVAQQLELLNARKWADGIMKQPDDGNHQSSRRFVWTDEVSVDVKCVYWQEY